MTQESKQVKPGPSELEKLAEFIRRSGKPQTLQALTRRYIEILKENK
jgi:hypothetical protein